MPHQLGTDEAGYGPNYGPLVISGTLWQTDRRDLQLYSLLKNSVTNSLPAENSLLIADSKTVYGSRKRLADLELPVLAVLYSMFQTVPSSWQELMEYVIEPRRLEDVEQETWLSGQRLTIPVAADLESVIHLGETFLKDCGRNRVSLKKIVSVPVFAGQFNHGIEEYGNKATLLSRSTLDIVRQLLNLTSDDVEVGCDKHGGRSRYAALIQETVTQEFVWVDRESLPVSEYRFREQGRSVDLRFEAKGESFLPTALASMVSKYVREIFMLIWNGFWQRHLPDLRPTQGYPQDAKRFKADISSVQTKLAIADRQIWRDR